MNTNLKPLSLYDHIDELRSRLFISFISIVLASFVAYFFIDQILQHIIKPVGQLYFLRPESAFLTKIGLSLFVGFLASLPVVIYQIWNFVSLGLKKDERKYIRLFGPLTFIFFFLGGFFSYFIAIPISIKFLLGFSTGYLVPMITIEHYISFFMTMILSFGIIFELPIILTFLTFIGVATPEFLIQKRRHAAVIIFIVSAIITPPDLITLWILSVPLLILYELGIWASKLTISRKLSIGN